MIQGLDLLLCQKFSRKASSQCPCKLDVPLSVQMVVHLHLESVCISNSPRWGLVLHGIMNSSHRCKFLLSDSGVFCFFLVLSFRLLFFLVGAQWLWPLRFRVVHTIP